MTPCISNIDVKNEKWPNNSNNIFSLRIIWLKINRTFSVFEIFKLIVRRPNHAGLTNNIPSIFKTNNFFKILQGPKNNLK